MEISAFNEIVNKADDAALNQDDYFINLARLAPPFLGEIRELAELWQTEGYELGLLEYYIYDLVNQAYVLTATWGLTFWEEMYGVKTDVTLSDEQRREVIIARIRGQGTTTIEMIKETAESFSGGEVDVIEDNPNHFFIIRFVGTKGIPRNMSAFVNMLEDIKPAHLAYKFEYRYTVWNDLKGKAWTDLAKKTWSEVRTMKEDE